MFDILRFCEDNEIDYSTTGKNVSEGWVNVQCPFCNDPSQHLGFDTETSKIFCWRCGGKKLTDFLIWTLKIEHTSPYGIPLPEIIKKYQTDKSENEIPFFEREEKQQKEIQLPIGSYQPSTNRNWNNFEGYGSYLKHRGFDTNEIIWDWFIYFGGPIGQFKHRIIIPIYHNNILVSYTGRDITGKQEPKYLTLYGSNIKDYLYGYSYCKDSVIVVEGCLDAWRIGRGKAVATFGTQCSIAQLRLLKKFKKVGVLFDKDAQDQAIKIVNHLILLRVEAYILPLALGAKDPAEMTTEQAGMIVKNFF